MDLEKILPEDGPPIEEVSKYIEKYMKLLKNFEFFILYSKN